LHAHCQSRNNQRTDQNFVKELVKPTEGNVVLWLPHEKNMVKNRKKYTNESL
jgi:hypothetical protein